jgi:hypothetical protein
MTARRPPPRAYLPHCGAGGGPPAAERAVEGASQRTMRAACPLHHALFASLGPRSPSRRFAGEVELRRLP